MLPAQAGMIRYLNESEPEIARQMLDHDMRQQVDGLLAEFIARGATMAEALATLRRVTRDQ